MGPSWRDVLRCRRLQTARNHVAFPDEGSLSWTSWQMADVESNQM